MRAEDIISNPDLPSPYEIPIVLHEQGLDKKIMQKLYESFKSPVHCIDVKSADNFAARLFIDGMKGVGARTASILSSLEPVYGIVLALAFLKESPSLRTVSGGAIVLAAALAATVRARRRI